MTCLIGYRLVQNSKKAFSETNCTRTVSKRFTHKCNTITTQLVNKCINVSTSKCNFWFKLQILWNDRIILFIKEKKKNFPNYGDYWNSHHSLESFFLKDCVNSAPLEVFQAWIIHLQWHVISIGWRSRLWRGPSQTLLFLRGGSTGVFGVTIMLLELEL